MKKKNKKNYKILLIILGLIILTYLLLLVFLGEQKIESGKQYDNSKYYELYINNEIVGIDVDQIESIPILPGILNYEKLSSNIFGVEEIDREDINKNITHKYSLGDRMLIKLVAYECYGDEKRTNKINCTNASMNLKEIELDEFNILITRSEKNETGTEVEKTMYNGKLTEDMSQYFPINDEYTIELTSTSWFVNTTIRLYLDFN